MQTHHIALAASAADFLVSLDGGMVKTSGSVDETLKEDPKLFIEEAKDEMSAEVADEVDLVDGKPDLTSNEPKSDGKLVRFFIYYSRKSLETDHCLN